MKKLYTLAATLLVAGSFSARAQDTLLYESFNFDAFYTDSSVVAPPSDIAIDPLWYNYDEDGLPDASGASTARAPEWEPSWPFANADTLDMDMDGANDNFVIRSSSWSNQGEMGTPTSNWLITRSIMLGAHDTLFWKSAPYQTPLYLDGYEVRISTTTNSDLNFNTLVFRGAEYTGSPGNDSVFSGYTFAPTTGTPTPFIHGYDYTYIEDQGDSARWNGILRPFMVPLDAYANMKVFVAFRHYTHDDNLFSIDDVMVRGTAPTIGINEASNSISLNVFPNPASDNVQVNYTLVNSSVVTISVYDITGKMVMSSNKDVQSIGYHSEKLSTEGLNSGFYTVTVSTESGRSTTKLIVK